MFHCPAHKNATAPAAQVAVNAVQQAARNPGYEVFDHRNGERVSGPYRSIRFARNRRDYLDIEYGAVRFGVRSVV